jgi:Flp pilus assembly protein TadB
LLGSTGANADLATAGTLERLLDSWEATRPSPALRTDLDITAISWQQLLRRCVLGVTVTAGCAIMIALAAALTGVSLSGSVLAIGGLLLAAFAGAMPVLTVRRRRHVRATLPGYLDLVTVVLAAGDSLEAGLRHCARLGSGWIYQRIQDALDEAALRRVSAADAFSQLGAAIGVTELVDLADSLAVASTGGTGIRSSLAVRASALREHQLADVETTAGRMTEGMAFPLACLVIGFIILIGYPAIVGLSTGLASP